jgi:superfamily I DNA/RNA helicase
MATHSAAAVAASAASWAKSKDAPKPVFKPVAKAARIASNFTPSIQQQNFFNWIENGEGSLVLEALAGAGKTSSLIEGLSRMQGRVFFGAYNKKIVEELQARVPNSPNVKISTMHGVGYGYLKQIAPNAVLDYNKMRDIYRAIAGYDKQLKSHEAAILNLVAFAKQAAIGIICSIEDKDAWYEQIDYYNVDCGNDHDIVIFNAIRTLKRSIELCVEKIDFEDMIYYPLLKNAIKPTYDWVLADELQDYNTTRRMMALAMLKPTGRFVGVGDKNQAIYAFSGADHNSMDLMQSATNAATLPLSVSFRCPTLVIAEAQKYVPEIQAREGAPEGIVRWAAFETIFEEAKIGDAVLCRYNAPIVELAYHFILKGIPAKIEGKDIGANLKALAKKWVTPKTLHEYRTKLHEYRDKNVEKFKEEKKEYLGEALSDKVGCLDAVINRLLIKKAVGNPTDLLCAEIEAIFGETIKGDSSTYVVLSSRHKAKGLEFNKVINLVHAPSKRKFQDYEVIAERNLDYVAITRAKHELVYMPLPKLGN